MCFDCRPLHLATTQFHDAVIFEFSSQKRNSLTLGCNVNRTSNTVFTRHTNLAIITHSNAEFVVDFVNVMPGTPKSKVKSRVILTPMHAKRFMKALVENVERYEAANGTIADMLPVEIPMNFGGPTAQA